VFESRSALELPDMQGFLDIGAVTDSRSGISLPDVVRSATIRPESFRSSLIKPDRAMRARKRHHPYPSQKYGMFATELRRDSDLGVVQHMLGHQDIHTTEAYYGHYDLSDLERAMNSSRVDGATPSMIPTECRADPHR
jgi:hypothetical protein